MTTIEMPTAASATSSSLARIVSVVKLQFANPATVVFLPLMFLGMIFVINWAIWALLVNVLPVEELGPNGGMADGTQWSGASTFIFVWQMIVAIQAMNATFPYAQGFGVTRRDYYLGTALAWVLTAAVWAILFGTLALIEEATGGWGLGGTMFSAIYFSADGPWMLFVYVFLLFLLFMFLGTVSGALYVRYRALGVTLFWAGVAFALVALLALAVVTNSWDGLFRFFGTLGVSGTYALSLIPAALAAVGGFFVLRRATPRG